MNRSRFLVALGLLDIGIFAVVAAFLPRASSFSWRPGNPIDYFVASRTHWDIAWATFVGSVIISAGIYLAATSFTRSCERDEK
jgi:hypothetical protein